MRNEASGHKGLWKTGMCGFHRSSENPPDTESKKNLCQPAGSSQKRETAYGSRACGVVRGDMLCVCVYAEMRVGSWNSVCVPRPHPYNVCCGGVLLSHTLPGAVPSALAGLASRFGMGAGRFPAAMTTTRWFNQYSLLYAPSVWGFVLVVIRIVATSTLTCLSTPCG